MSETPIVNLDEILRPPTDEEVARAIAMFAEAVRAHYGDRLKGLYLFGSRARGDHHPDSDADIAVVLADGDWGGVREKMELADIAYDPIVETGVHVQGWPVSESRWDDPQSRPNPSLVSNMKRDGKALPLR
jgi:predicted nucleotidyltransferase